MSTQLKILNVILRMYVKPMMGRMKLHGKDLKSVRRRAELIASMASAPPFAVIEAALLNGVPGEWVRGKRRDGSVISSERALLYLHGGGYIACSPRTHRTITARLAKYAKCDVFAADYRLAPEHPFPAALEDALNAYRGLLDSGYHPESIIIGGDSAGGNLAMATLLAIKKEKLPMPAAGVGISPWLNLSHPAGTILGNQRKDPMLPARRLAELARVVLAGEDPFNPIASPVYANFRGLPPLLLHAGSTEIILDDVKLMAERAKQDGVEVTLRIFEKTPHVIHAFAPHVPEGRRAITEVAEFCEKRFSVSAGITKGIKKGPK